MYYLVRKQNRVTISGYTVTTMSDYLIREMQSLCPYCNASISLLIDTSLAEQQYIEDCEVCCRPISVKLVYTDELNYQLQLLQENEVS